MSKADIEFEIDLQNYYNDCMAIYDKYHLTK